MGKVQNERIRQLCRVTKGVDEKIDEGVLLWFGRRTGLLRGSTLGSVLVVTQWVGRGIGGLIPSKTT